ncbi:Multicopper oxidase, type 1 [Sesbania bispinosa]|nr:Multicopper oxidase, type 1 [Sesbania bispinosa]
MKLLVFSVAWGFALLASSFASAATVEHTLKVQNKTIKRLCIKQVIVTVNGRFPGPQINVREGDTVIVHLFNDAPYNITIHWYRPGPMHGVFQLFSAWADGPEYVTQCPISPGNNYTYKFKVTKQEGTLWWHAHASVLRATVHGAFIIHPRSGRFPFPKPYKQVPIILGDWYDANVVDIEAQALASGGSLRISDAFTINGLPGDLYNCSQNTHKFYSNITSLVGAPHWVPVPLKVDEHMFITIGLSLERCDLVNDTCQGPLKQRFSSSMNNESFVIPKGRGFSMLEAFFKNVSGVYSADFPNNPPIMFDFTSPDVSFDENLIFAPKSTKVKRLKFNSVVDIVFQNTAIIGVQNHPMHIHGFSFHVLAQGFGNFDYNRDRVMFNLVNPQIRNTIAVPAGGWAVVRFQANNPGVWFVHCHVEDHVPWGLDMAFEVENGPTPSTSLPPPPADLPKC